MKKKPKSRAKAPKVPEIVGARKEPKASIEVLDEDSSLDAEELNPEILEAEAAAFAPKEREEVHLPAILAETPLAPVPVGPRDPLERYIAEIRRHPVLAPEEQLALAQKFRETNDPDLARRLVITNLRLVVKIALEYRNSYQNVLDLIQEGNVGLLKAVANFDPYKGTRLSYYASWWIRSYILKFLLDNFRLVKIGTTQAQKKLFYNLMREKERLEAQGLEVGTKLLADRLHVKESEVAQMDFRLSSHGTEVSLDQPFNHGGSESVTAPRDYLESQQVPADEELALAQLKEVLMNQVDSFVETLGEKERVIFRERLLSETPLTLQEIADKYGFTRERARQIEARVLEKLREQLRPKLGLPQATVAKKVKPQRGSRD